VISAKRALLALGLLALTALALPGSTLAAALGPAWAISTDAYSPGHFTAGQSSGKDTYVVIATNVGSKATDGSPITVTDVLPAGLTVNPTPAKPGLSSFYNLRNERDGQSPCTDGPPVTCTATEVVQPGDALRLTVPVDVDAGAPPLVTNQVSVSGGGALGASDSVQTPVSSDPAPFAIQTLRNTFSDAGGAATSQAGAHPYQFRIAAQFTTPDSSSIPLSPVEAPHEISADLPKGLVVNPRATTVRCSEVQLESAPPTCPDASAVGIERFTHGLNGYAVIAQSEPVYNMVPPPGTPAELAFNVLNLGAVIHLQGRVRSDGDYGLSADARDIPEIGSVSGVSIELWGNPADPSHDFQRGQCAFQEHPASKTCPVPASSTPLLTMPSACSGPLATTLRADSWQHRGTFVSKSAQSTDPTGNPVGVNGCESLSYDPSVDAVPSTDQAETGTALDFNVDFPNNGLDKFGSLAESNTEKAVVTLPEGVTINPSVGEGLGFCTPAQYEREQTFSVEGEGCPGDSKLGSLHLTTPLLDEAIDGSVYLAQQDDPTTSQHGAENPFDTDVALYLILRNTKVGVMVKQALKVVPDPRTGQLVATLEDIPELPFSHFNFHFREGARAALVTPASCGTYTAAAKFYPYSDPAHPKTVTSDFKIAKGVHGGPCPSSGTPPFNPEYQAGSVNNNAKSYSPFLMRLMRHDGDQDMTKFSTVLPPGVLGKLAGVGKCSDAAIAAAKDKTGRQEEAGPSCPASAEIGHTIAGAGVGDSLTYVPGHLYLAGSYHGDPLSVVAITPAVAGPFDAGTVVVREALTLNPVTAEVEVDGANSDPIPHILKGIVLKVRDLRVNVDRPDFIVNPTSCDESSARATLFGAYRDVFSSLDDVPVSLSARYQAASCASLPFEPLLKIQLKGGTKRGDHPALKAVVNARPQDANIGGAVVTLPPSAFLDQSHIRTICTRVQYVANGGSGGGCPKAAQYGYARAWTPLLDEPVEGPVYLRSSDHNLPDLVAALHGIVNVDVVGRIDSFKGGIRSSFETLPDAPVSRFVLTMQGGKKGLVVNSRNLCFESQRNRAIANFTGQNGTPKDFKPLMRAQCGKKDRQHHRHRARHEAP
jgi:hypothetical protein